MTQIEFIAECQRLFALNGLPCTTEQAEMLFLLTDRMLTVNQSMNLTAIKEEKSVILRHYVDSLTIMREIPEAARVMDVGCGAGFPTLPLAIARPDLTIVALDGTAKRIHYVQETAGLLGLSNVTAIAGRAEEYAHQNDYRETFDVVTARAVASLPVLCELCLPFVRIGGALIAMKSAQVQEELAQAAKCIEICGGRVTNCRSCDLMDGTVNESRTLIVVSKIVPTPKNYPRHFSKISKKPL